MGGMGRWALQCRVEHLRHPLVIMGAGATRSLFVVKSFHALVVARTLPQVLWTKRV